jgi:hypothetical protein
VSANIILILFLPCLVLGSGHFFIFFGGAFGMLMRKGPIGVYGLPTFLDQKLWHAAASTLDDGLGGWILL